MEHAAVGLTRHTVFGHLCGDQAGLGGIDHDLAEHRLPMRVHGVAPVAHVQPGRGDPLIAV